jgi:hypothetical protein
MPRVSDRVEIKFVRRVLLTGSRRPPRVTAAAAEARDEACCAANRELVEVFCIFRSVHGCGALNSCSLMPNRKTEGNGQQDATQCKVKLLCCDECLNISMHDSCVLLKPRSKFPVELWIQVVSTNAECLKIPTFHGAP